jgi:hypothetical protein
MGTAGLWEDVSRLSCRLSAMIHISTLARLIARTANAEFKELSATR